MRVTEKSFELTICAHMTLALWGAGWTGIWFGLSQKQEAALGFDVATRVGGVLLLLQFKASTRVTAEGRVFVLPWHQMQALIRHAGGPWRGVYYVLPNIGTTLELARRVPRLLEEVWMLDVAELKRQQQILLPPTGRRPCHRLYLCPPFAELRSERLRLTVQPASAVVTELEARFQTPQVVDETDEPIPRLRQDGLTGDAIRYIGRKALGLVLWRRR